MRPRQTAPEEAPLTFTRVLIIVGLICGVVALLGALAGYEPPLPATMLERYNRDARDGVRAHEHRRPRRQLPERRRSQQDDVEASGDRDDGDDADAAAARLQAKRRAAAIKPDRELEQEEQPPPAAPGRKRVLVKTCPACPACPFVEPPVCTCDPAPAPVACPDPPPLPPPAAAPPAPATTACPAGDDAIAAFDGYSPARAQRADKSVFNTLAEAVAATKHPRLNLATFIQGNAGFHPLTKNWIALVRRMTPALPYFVVALDAQELENVKALGAPVLRETRKQYDSAPSSYRQGGYNLMTMNKWGVTRDILAMGVNAFMVDPDIAMLRNPLPYFETLPTCDYITMMEGDSIDGRADEVIASGGFAQKAYDIVYDNLMNTGYSLYRSTERMRAVLDEFEAYVGGGAGHMGVEDQTIWANFIRERFEIKGAPRSADNGARGRAVVDAILQGRCIEYVRPGDAAQAVVFTFHPLNPHMFMNRPAHDTRKLQEKVLERPFAVHYNYLVGTDSKVQGMRNNGHYIV